MSDFGIKISKEGDDVFQSADKDLIYTSQLFGLKVYKTGITSVTIPGSSADSSVHYTDISHDLGYAPAFFAFVEAEDGDMININAPFLLDLMESTAYIDAFAWSDTSKLRLCLSVADCLATDITRSFKYYIFVEPTT